MFGWGGVFILFRKHFFFLRKKVEVLRAGKNAVAIHPVQPSEGGRAWPLSSAEPGPFLRALG